MAPWLHFLLLTFFEFFHKFLTLFSNRNHFQKFYFVKIFEFGSEKKNLIMQMAPWLQLLLVTNFEFPHKKMTLFSNPTDFWALGTPFKGQKCPKWAFSCDPITPVHCQLLFRLDKRALVRASGAYYSSTT